jgi:hypothetical protein
MRETDVQIALEDSIRNESPEMKQELALFEAQKRNQGSATTEHDTSQVQRKTKSEHGLPKDEATKIYYRRKHPRPDPKVRTHSHEFPNKKKQNIHQVDLETDREATVSERSEAKSDISVLLDQFQTTSDENYLKEAVAIVSTTTQPELVHTLFSSLKTSEVMKEKLHLLSPLIERFSFSDADDDPVTQAVNEEIDENRDILVEAIVKDLTVKHEPNLLLNFKYYHDRENKWEKIKHMEVKETEEEWTYLDMDQWNKEAVDRLLKEVDRSLADNDDFTLEDCVKFGLENLIPETFAKNVEFEYQYAIDKYYSAHRNYVGFTFFKSLAPKEEKLLQGELLQRVIYLKTLRRRKDKDTEMLSEKGTENEKEDDSDLLLVSSKYEDCLRYDRLDILNTLAEATGIPADADPFKKLLLKNPDFSSPIPYEISPELLEEHFSRDIQKRTIKEYQRIYAITHCDDFYEKKIEEYEKASKDTSKFDIPSLTREYTDKAKSELIHLAAAFATEQKNNPEKYRDLRTKILATEKDQNEFLDNNLTTALLFLERQGDEGIVPIMKTIITDRVKERTEKGNNAAKENIYVETLTRIISQSAKDALLELSTAHDLNWSSREKILTNLIEVRNLFPIDLEDFLSTQLYDKGEKFDWDLLSFYQSIHKISNWDVREKSEQKFVEAIQLALTQGKDLNSLCFQLCPSVPKTDFTQLYLFTEGDPTLLEKFNALYEQTKKSAQRDSLLAGITYSLDLSIEAKRTLTETLKGISFSSENSAGMISEIIKGITILHTIKNQTGKETIHSYANKHYDSLSELQQAIYNDLADNLQSIFPHDSIRISGEKFKEITDNWGTIEPLIVYQQKILAEDYVGVAKFVTEMVEHFDPPAYKEWQKWRYDLNNPIVNKAIGYLSPEERVLWQSNYFTDMGEVITNFTSEDKPQQITSLLQNAIIQSHIYSPEVNNFASKEKKNIQIELSKIMNELNHENEKEILTQQLLSFKKEKDILEQWFLLDEEKRQLLWFEKNQDQWKIKEDRRQKERESLGLTAETIEEEKKDLEVKLETKIPVIKEYTTKIKEIRIKYGKQQPSNEDARKTLKDQRENEEEVLARSLLGENYRQDLNAYKRYNQILNTLPQPLFISEETQKTLTKYGLTTKSDYAILMNAFKSIDDQLKNLITNPVFEKYELNSLLSKRLDLLPTLEQINMTINLLQLMQLTPTQIAMDKLAGKDLAKGERITQLIDNMKTYFKDNETFLQDLNNVVATMDLHESIVTRRRLGMVLTDNPQVLFQIGKYPIGNGSCQNYEGSPAFNRALPGYVGNAHIKGALLLDLNKLPRHINDRLTREGFEAIKEEVTPQQMLDATIARTIIKLTNKEDRPVPVIEPTYSQVYKSDTSMDDLFNQFIQVTVAEPMKTQIARRGGHEIVEVPASRNPEGQYEDLNGLGISKIPLSSYSLLIQLLSSRSWM